LFVVSDGKILGHIVSKEGIYIDLDRVKVINELNPPTSKKGVQSFLGKIKFVRRFVPDHATIVKPIDTLLKKDQRFDWTQEIQSEFTNIKHEITNAPMLIIPYFNKYFIIYSFSSEDTIATILTQRKDSKEEHPISFMSKGLQEYELKYSPMENQAFFLIKVVSYFRTYILTSHLIVYVPYPPTKMMLSQHLREGRWGNWMATLK
jgi:hypothetical protein